MRQLIESADGVMVDLLFTPGSKPEPLQYERKAVVFYDVLGWRNQIQKAGNDPEKIAMLQRVILRPIQSLRAGAKTLNFKFSAFSDNIAISCAAKQDSVFHLLVALGSFVLKRIARSPLEDKEYQKVEWLYDRVASRLGVPLLKSYPRLYPKGAT